MKIKKAKSLEELYEIYSWYKGLKNIEGLNKNIEENYDRFELEKTLFSIGYEVLRSGDIYMIPSPRSTFGWFEKYAFTPLEFPKKFIRKQYEGEDDEASEIYRHNLELILSSCGIEIKD